MYFVFDDFDATWQETDLFPIPTSILTTFNNLDRLFS